MSWIVFRILARETPVLFVCGSPSPWLRTLREHFAFAIASEQVRFVDGHDQLYERLNTAIGQNHGATVLLCQKYHTISVGKLELLRRRKGTHWFHIMTQYDLNAQVGTGVPSVPVTPVDRGSLIGIAGSPISLVHEDLNMSVILPQFGFNPSDFETVELRPRMSEQSLLQSVLHCKPEAVILSRWKEEWNREQVLRHAGVGKIWTGHSIGKALLSLREAIT